jgi:hypothetical protein
MGARNSKRTLLKKITSLNLYIDQAVQIEALMEATRAEKEAPVLRQLMTKLCGSPPEICSTHSPSCLRPRRIFLRLFRPWSLVEDDWSGESTSQMQVGLELIQRQWRKPIAEK